MSAISQYASAPTPITGQFGYTFVDTTILNATLPVAAATYTDCVSETVQAGKYLIEFSLTLSALATTELTDMVSYISPSAGGTAHIAFQSEGLTPTITLAADHLLYYRISKYVHVTAETTYYGGMLGTVGVLPVGVSSVLMNITKLSP